MKKKPMSDRIRLKHRAVSREDLYRADPGIDKNRFVLVALLAVCALLVVLIFYVSNHPQVLSWNAADGVSRAEIASAYEFLDQQEAVDAALELVSEPCTCEEYRMFLEELHLWDAAQMSTLTDWQPEAYLDAELLERSRKRVEDLFVSMDVQQTADAELSEAERIEQQLSQMDAQTPVRVLLLQNGACVADEIRFSANDTYTITFHGKLKQKQKDQVIRAGQLHLEIGESAVIRSENGGLYLTDDKGARTTLGYQGSFRITRYAEGYAVLNEVSIEQYLYGVVQSEMPAYFEMEALKAQAVCARTYVVSYLLDPYYPQYNADVDDSVRFQAYNQAAPDTRVVQAVDEVCGQIATCEDRPIQAYFFSTSHGITNGCEVWGLPDASYIKNVRGNADDTAVDLGSEEQFRKFIKKTDAKDYDADSSYYRWKADLDLSQNEKTVRKLLKNDTLSRVTFYDENGAAATADAIGDLGELQQLQVVTRTKSGAVKTLVLVFEHGKAELSNENFIRQVLGCLIQKLSDKDGNELAKESTMLPSVCFYVQPIRDGCVLYGGGLGHGIGMSQYGANELARRGSTMQEILDTYYDQIELRQLYGKE